MNLIVYSCCRESDRNSNEEPLKVEWSEEVPDVGQSVSMGDQRRWFKVKVNRYQTDHQDFDVYFVHVNRTLSTPMQWDCDGCENEAVHIELSEVGQPILGFAFNVAGRSPQLGARLRTYTPTSHPTLMQESLSDWVIDSINECLPEESAPYRAIYLSWCRQLAIVA